MIPVPPGEALRQHAAGKVISNPDAEPKKLRDDAVVKAYQILKENAPK